MPAFIVNITKILGDSGEELPTDAVIIAQTAEEGKHLLDLAVRDNDQMRRENPRDTWTDLYVVDWQTWREMPSDTIWLAVRGELQRPLLVPNEIFLEIRESGVWDPDSAKPDFG